MSEERHVAFAVAAHPDDIEFMMSGTLMLLGGAGWELHYMNIADGSCGTATLAREEIVEIRRGEAREAAALAGAKWHPSVCHDIEVFYEKGLLARVGAVVRDVNPSLMLVPSPEDYMEDHMNASRLAVTAGFCRGMRNFPTDPHHAPVSGDLTVYHALPYGLCDGLRRRVFAGEYVDVSGVMEKKREMLSKHRSQKEWLDKSQGLNAYVETLDEMCAEVGRMSGAFEFAEGWRRHSHLGFSAEDRDPLREALGGKVKVDETYERALSGGRLG